MFCLFSPVFAAYEAESGEVCVGVRPTPTEPGNSVFTFSVMYHL